jgi:two-component system nitrogen regulation response regulator GlnG
MAPAQVIELKDLPPEVLGTANEPHALELHDSLDDGSPEPTFENSSQDFSYKPSTSPVVLNLPGADWEQGFEAEAMSLLVAGRTDVWDAMVNRVEARLIQTALANTRGRRIEAAQKLGIGRNTITRKIQELGIRE